jgi:hypothetical protein
MAETADELIAKHRAEIDRVARTIADVESSSFEGPSKAQVLEILRSSLRLHQRTLARLETQHGG